MRRAMTAKDWLGLALLSVLWGGSFLFVGIAIRELPPLTLVCLRVGIAALALLVTARMLKVALPRGRGIWRDLFVMALMNNTVPFSLIAWGQAHIPSGMASILNATIPLFTVAVAHVATRDEKANGPRLAGVLCGIAGVAVMVGPSALEGLGGQLLPQLAVLAAAFAYACSSIYGRRFATFGLQPLPIATGQLCASAILMLPAALAVDLPWRLPVPHGSTVVAVLGLALLSTAFAYILFFHLLARAGATNLTLVTFLIPVSALLLGATVLGESVEPRQIAGMALIALGLACIDGRLLRRLRAFTKT